MATPFYNNFLTENIPYVIKSITERLLVYYADSLYKPIPLEEALNRFVLSNLGDDGTSIKRIIDKSKNNQGVFPFTAYNVDTVEMQDGGFSHFQKNGSYYSHDYDCYIVAVPIVVTFGFVTFFATAQDFWKAYTILQEDNINVNSLDVPITINGKLTSYKILFDNVTEKGDLSFDIEQQFQYGRIYPLTHATTVNSIFYLIDYNIEPHSTKIVYHVDDIILKLHELENQKEEAKQTIIVEENLKIVDSNPINNSKDISKNLETISLDFNIPYDKDTFNYNITPMVNHSISFSNDLKNVTITLKEELLSNTKYILTVFKDTSSIYSTYPIEDTTISFTTEE